MIFKRRLLHIAACVFAILSISPVAIGIDITIDYDEYLVSPYSYMTCYILDVGIPPLLSSGLNML